MSDRDLGHIAGLAIGDTAGAIATELDMSVVNGLLEEAGRTMIAG